MVLVALGVDSLLFAFSSFIKSKIIFKRTRSQSALPSSPQSNVVSWNASARCCVSVQMLRSVTFALSCRRMRACGCGSCIKHRRGKDAVAFRLSLSFCLVVIILPRARPTGLPPQDLHKKRPGATWTKVILTCAAATPGTGRFSLRRENPKV